jgi:hypothetical protein
MSLNNSKTPGFLARGDHILFVNGAPLPL